MNETQNFEQILEKIASPYYQKILQSEFVREILVGTLPQEKFCQYLSQDSLYLNQEAKLLNQLSQKCSLKDESDFFLAMSEDCIAIETQMQATFLTTFSISPAKKLTGDFSQYIAFLQNQLSAPLPLAIFAYFPCYYLYAQLGKALASHPQTAGNIYQSYLDTYAGEPYKYFVDRYSDILQKYFRLFSPDEKKRAFLLFETACKFESQIFQGA